MTAPRRPLTSHAAALLCAAAIAAAPDAAHAQFGKLKDLGKRAAATAVEKKVEGEASKKIGGAVAADAGAEARPRSVEFTDDVVEITEARIAQLSRGVDAEAAARPAAEQRYQAKLAALKEADRTYEARRAAYDREYAAWDRRKTEIEACNDRVAKKYEDAGDDGDARRSQEIHDKLDAEMTDAEEARLKSLADRMEAADKRGDQATVRVLADSIQREMAGVMAAGRDAMAMSQRANATSEAMQKESRACGTVPPAPKSPDSGGMIDVDMARREASAAGAKAAGLSERQYAVLRERVEGFARLKGRTGRSPLSYTAGELQALSGDAAKALFAKPAFAKTESWAPEGE